MSNIYDKARIKSGDPLGKISEAAKKASTLFSQYAHRGEIIDEINKAVDIPIISEKTEKAILEALWKVIKNVLLKKIGL